MLSEYSVVRQDRFIEATRDSGYKGTDSALSELIDNSIQAGATSVDIVMRAVEEGIEGRGRPPLPRVVEVVIADNGRGMDSDTLRRSLRFGDTTRFNDRSGLGRFGMGLPNASIGQCQRVEIYTWKRGVSPIWTYIDKDEIATGKMVEVPRPAEVPIPAPLRELASSPSGTIVIWKKCDRLDHDRKLDTLLRSLRSSLGRIFRHFLVANFRLALNGTTIGPLDPLYLMPEARTGDDHLASQHGEILKFHIPIPGNMDHTSTVEVVFSLLPAEWQTRYKHDQEERRRRHISTTRGFSIVRARREIDLIKSPYHARHWTDDWYRVEIRFDPELDEVFGVTHTKQHARIAPGSPLYDRLAEAIRGNVNTLKATIVARGKEAHRAHTKRAEETARKSLPRLKPVEVLANKPLDRVEAEVRDFVYERSFKSSPESSRELEDRLAKYPVLIEYESLPGAPYYRTKLVGRTIVVLLNTHHRFYERCYRRIEKESPLGKTGIDLVLMSLARSEALASEGACDWYEDQRHEWSQHLKAFLEELDEVEEDDGDLDAA